MIGRDDRFPRCTHARLATDTTLTVLPALPSPRSLTFVPSPPASGAADEPRCVPRSCARPRGRAKTSLPARRFTRLRHPRRITESPMVCSTAAAPAPPTTLSVPRPSSHQPPLDVPSAILGMAPSQPLDHLSLEQPLSPNTPTPPATSYSGHARPRPRSRAVIHPPPTDLHPSLKSHEQCRPTHQPARPSYAAGPSSTGRRSPSGTGWATPTANGGAVGSAP